MVIKDHPLYSIKQEEINMESMQKKNCYFTNFSVALDIFRFLNVSLKQFYKFYKTRSFNIGGMPSDL